MELISLLYIILGVISFFTLVVVLIIIAGKDIYFAFARKFNSKGSDIFMLNSTRNIDRFYKTPKDGTFKINGATYLTNPDKTLGLSDEMKQEVRKSMDISLRNLNKNILKLSNKREQLNKQIIATDPIPANAEKIGLMRSLYTDLDNKIATLESKREKRDQGYFMSRRSCFLYIENDPVPKDLYEFYTELDSIQLDNVMARIQTKDPRNLKQLESDISLIKKLVIFGLIASAIAGWFAFQDHSQIQQLAQNMGVTLTLWAFLLEK